MRPNKSNPVKKTEYNKKQKKPVFSGNKKNAQVNLAENQDESDSESDTEFLLVMFLLMLRKETYFRLNWM